MNMHTAVLHTPDPEKTKPPVKEAPAKPKESLVLDGLGRPVPRKAPPPGAKPRRSEGRPREGRRGQGGRGELDFTKPIAVKIGNEVVQVEQSDELDFTAAPAPGSRRRATAALAATGGAAGSAGANPCWRASLRRK
jgi:hypothetical protein